MTLNLVNNLIEEIKTMLKEKYDKLICIFGIIDDDGLNIIYDHLPENANILIAIDDHFTTAETLSKLSKITDIYYVNNNNTSKKEQTNLIIGIKGNNAKVLFLGTNFLGYNLENNISASIIIDGDINELKSLIDKFDFNTYPKITPEYIKNLEENFELRNLKASTLTSEMDLDEIKMSFRRINEIDNKDEFIDKITKQKLINANKDDIIIENILDSNNLTKKSKEDLINFDIDIDLGE